MAGSEEAREQPNAAAIKDRFWEADGPSRAFAEAMNNEQLGRVRAGFIFDEGERDSADLVAYLEESMKRDQSDSPGMALAPYSWSPDGTPLDQEAIHRNFAMVVFSSVRPDVSYQHPTAGNEVVLNCFTPYDAGFVAAYTPDAPSPPATVTREEIQNSLDSCVEGGDDVDFSHMYYGGYIDGNVHRNTEQLAMRQN